ncbi:MAG: putative zinc-binding metallopeptidase [Bacteroidales bacterium]|nr:putative zinc-binding metallopeptidase [Bacteroides sp.]MCM1197418.1 putative zinc-binding metallopeptidase [Clostridium sp.]MCM1502908.1 putative zinc-binding metallopeptidase [Bacteroidales bacterium]
MKIIEFLKISMAAAVLFSAASCEKDIPGDESILHLPESYSTEFDEWLQRHYVEPYNVRIEYHLPDIESHFNYWVTPPEISKSIEIAKLLQHTTLGAMNEMMSTGSEDEDPTVFAKKYFPKVIYLVGNFEIAATGTTSLASAENGLQINILGVNYFNRAADSERIAGTMLHEFTHILDGIHNVPDEFRSITPNDYVGSKYTTYGYNECIKLGFISPYARSSIAEDIAETGGRIISCTDAQWEQFYRDAGEGREKLERKYNVIKAWLMDSFDVDADKWRDIYLRRLKELDSIDWTNLND